MIIDVFRPRIFKKSLSNLRDLTYESDPILEKTISLMNRVISMDKTTELSADEIVFLMKNSNEGYKVLVGSPNDVRRENCISRVERCKAVVLQKRRLL